MEVTNVFRAWVKTVKLKQKKLQVQAADGDVNGGTLRRQTEEEQKDVCPFTRRGKQIVKNITELRDHLLQHRRDYVNINRLWAEWCSMSEMDRDRIDSEAEQIIKNCSQLVKNFRATVRLEHCTPQRYQHRQNLVDSMERYLKAVCKIYSEQRAVRVKQASDMKRLSRLECLVKSSRAKPTPLENVEEKCKSEAADAGTEAEERPSLRKRRQPTRLTPSAVDDDASRNGFIPDSAYKFALEDERLSSVEEMNCSPEERIQLAKENEQIYQKMNSLVDEIDQIEGKVIEIARLQDIFTEKVLEQETDIYRINEVAIHTTENIRYGNEQIREAMKKRAGMRVWILFFLLVISFTLLFLDWYNS